MIINKKIKKEIEEIKDIECDLCGKSCEAGYGFECMELHANWGFGSNKDLEEWTAHICEKCVDEKLKFIKFNIKKY